MPETDRLLVTGIAEPSRSEAGLALSWQRWFRVGQVSSTIGTQLATAIKIKAWSLRIAQKSRAHSMEQNCWGYSKMEYTVDGGGGKMEAVMG